LFFRKLRINALFWKVRSFEEKLNLCFHGFFESNKISSNVWKFCFPFGMWDVMKWPKFITGVSLSPEFHILLQKTILFLKVASRLDHCSTWNKLQT
jgi:hypothetical protein